MVVADGEKPNTEEKNGVGATQETIIARNLSSVSSFSLRWALNGHQFIYLLLCS